MKKVLFRLKTHMVKPRQLSENTYSTLGTSTSIIMVWATAYIRCFLRIEIACMCHVVNYTLLYGRHRSEYHFGLNAFERNEIISINCMFLKSVIHFIFVCFHAILNSAKTNMVIITIKIARLSSWNQYIVNMSNVNLSLYPQIQSNQNIKHSNFIENLPKFTSINLL